MQPKKEPTYEPLNEDGLPPEDPFGDVAPSTPIRGLCDNMGLLLEDPATPGQQGSGR